MTSMRQCQVPTPRILVIEFMRAPFGGMRLEPGWLAVEQIADGTGLKPYEVRRVLRARRTFEARPGRTETVYRFRP